MSGAEQLAAERAVIGPGAPRRSASSNLRNCSAAERVVQPRARRTFMHDERAAQCPMRVISAHCDKVMPGSDMLIWSWRVAGVFLRTRTSSWRARLGRSRSGTGDQRAE